MSLPMQEQLLAVIFKMSNGVARQEDVIHPFNHVGRIFIGRLLGYMQTLYAKQQQTFKQVGFHSLMHLAQIARLEIMQYGLSVGNGVFYALYLILICTYFVIVVGYGKGAA